MAATAGGRNCVLQRAYRYGQQYLNEGPALLHSFWQGWAARVGERLSRQFAMPHLTTLMGQDVLPANRRHLRHLTQKDEARLVALSGFHNDILEQTTGLRAAQVIPWGLNVDEIPTNFPENRPVDVLGVGSLIDVKDWPSWLRVVRKAADRQPGIRAELVGDGPERARLQRLSARLHLEKNVLFTGVLPRPKVLKKMHEAKVLLHTSRFESFGFVLAEAAAQGCRTLSTPVGIAPEFDCTGKNEADLTEQLLRLLDLPPRLEPLVPFTMLQAARQYLDLYQSMMD